MGVSVSHNGSNSTLCWILTDKENDSLHGNDKMAQNDKDVDMYYALSYSRTKFVLCLESLFPPFDGSYLNSSNHFRSQTHFSHYEPSLVELWRHERTWKFILVLDNFLVLGIFQIGEN